MEAVAHTITQIQIMMDLTTVVEMTNGAMTVTRGSKYYYHYLLLLLLLTQIFPINSYQKWQGHLQNRDQCNRFEGAMQIGWLQDRQSRSRLEMGLQGQYQNRTKSLHS